MTSSLRIIPGDRQYCVSVKGRNTSRGSAWGMAFACHIWLQSWLNSITFTNSTRVDTDSPWWLNTFHKQFHSPQKRLHSPQAEGLLLVLNITLQFLKKYVFMRKGPRRPEECVRSLGTGVTGRCEPPCLGARNIMLVFWKNSKTSLLLRCLSRPHSALHKISRN